MALPYRHMVLLLGLTSGGCDFELDFGDGLFGGQDGPPQPYVYCDWCEGPRAVGEVITIETRFHAYCSTILWPTPCDFQDYALEVGCDGVACEITGPDQGEGQGTFTEVRPLEPGEVSLWVRMNAHERQMSPFTIMAADRIDVHCYAGTPAEPCAGEVLDAPVLMDLALMAGRQRLLTEPAAAATVPLEWVLMDGPSLDPDRFAAGELAHVVRLRNVEGAVSVKAEHEGVAVAIDLWIRGAAQGQGGPARP